MDTRAVPGLETKEALVEIEEFELKVAPAIGTFTGPSASAARLQGQRVS